MGMQGTYPLRGRSLSPSDNVTGVVGGATADIPLNILQAFILGGAAQSGPTSGRPAPIFIGQAYFDTTLGFMIWASILSPATWVNAAGVSV